ncbi:MAG: hypothetical protein ABIZ91_09835 [Gemmatimonadaceae bacterium]
MNTRRFLTGLSFFALFTTAACGTDAPATAPAFDQLGNAAVVASSTETDKDARKARIKMLDAQRDSIRHAAKAMKKQLRAQYDIDKATWKAFKKEWKLQQRLDMFANLELLRCEPLEYDADAEVIGPEGGKLKIGPHELVIPAGALSQDELISGTAPMGDLVQVNFGPHGLQFLRSAQLTFSYEHCMAPADYRFQVVYVDESLRILEAPPSNDKKSVQRVEGRIDHFSSYMIAY